MKALALLLCLAAAPLAQAQVMTKGNAVKATTTVHDDGTRSTMVVDPEKQSAEETFFDHSGKVIRKTVYPLDGQNQPIGAVLYNPKGQVVTKSSYKRDDFGRIEQETITNANGQILRRRVYAYGSGNKVSRIDEYDANGVMIAPQKKATTTAPTTKKKR